MSTAPSAQPEKKRRFVQRIQSVVQNLKDSYTISRRTYPWIGWAMVGTVLLLICLAVVLALVTQQAIWYWVLMAVPLALAADVAILSWTTRRASYTQIEGKSGAAKLVLDQSLGRGWNLESDPVYVNRKTGDVIWRMVGRPGVVLVAEGPTGRLQRPVADEQKILRRILSTVPVHVINVGIDEGQTRLIDLWPTIRRLPTKPTRLTDTEISQVSKRLSSLSSKGLPIPKGIDPTKIRPDRRAMRGR